MSSGQRRGYVTAAKRMGREGPQKPIPCVYTVESYKKLGVWNAVKRCYCSEIMDLDMHVDKITKIIFG